MNRRSLFLAVIAGVMSIFAPQKPVTKRDIVDGMDLSLGNGEYQLVDVAWPEDGLIYGFFAAKDSQSKLGVKIITAVYDLEKGKKLRVGQWAQLKEQIDDTRRV